MNRRQAIRNGLLTLGAAIVAPLAYCKRKPQTTILPPVRDNLVPMPKVKPPRKLMGRRIAKIELVANEPGCDASMTLGYIQIVGQGWNAGQPCLDCELVQTAPEDVVRWFVESFPNWRIAQ